MNIYSSLVNFVFPNSKIDYKSPSIFEFILTSIGIIFLVFLPIINCLLLIDFSTVSALFTLLYLCILLLLIQVDRKNTKYNPYSLEEMLGVFLVKTVFFYAYIIHLSQLDELEDRNTTCFAFIFWCIILVISLIVLIITLLSEINLIFLSNTFDQKNTIWFLYLFLSVFSSILLYKVYGYIQDIIYDV